MTKYNINPKEKKQAAYCRLVGKERRQELKTAIVALLKKKKKYKDRSYSARQLAADLGTNTRYVSAVLNLCFGMNYTSLVNKYRIEDARQMMADKHYAHLSMEELSVMVGFSNRQSFYAAFYRYVGVPPKQYQLALTQPKQAEEDGLQSQDLKDEKIV